METKEKLLLKELLLKKVMIKRTIIEILTILIFIIQSYFNFLFKTILRLKIFLIRKLRGMKRRYELSV